MDNNNNHPILAAFNYTISIISASFSVVTISQVQPIVTLVGSIIALTSGIFAIRYYHFATKKVKKK
jgi:hypothetical protein